MNNVLSIFLLLVIAALVYRVLLYLSDISVSKKYVLKGYMNQKEDISISNIDDKLSFFKRYNYRLERIFEEANLSINPVTFTFRRVSLALIMLVVMFAMYRYTGLSYYLYLAVPFAFLSYRFPMRSIKKAKKRYDLRMKQQLPEYLSCFGSLLQTNTPYEATKKSEQYARDLLKPHVQRLITQIDLFPGSMKPYEEFAHNVNIPQAREFVIALSQLMKVDSSQGSKILKNQLKIMDDIEDEALKELVSGRREEVDTITSTLLVALYAVIGLFIAMALKDAFTMIS